MLDLASMPGLHTMRHPESHDWPQQRHIDRRLLRRARRRGRSKARATRQPRRPTI